MPTNVNDTLGQQSNHSQLTSRPTPTLIARKNGHGGLVDSCTDIDAEEWIVSSIINDADYAIPRIPDSLPDQCYIERVQIFVREALRLRADGEPVDEWHLRARLA